MTAIIQDPDLILNRHPDLSDRLEEVDQIIDRETPLANAGCQTATQLVVNAHLEQEKIWEELEELELSFWEDENAWRL